MDQGSGVVVAVRGVREQGVFESGGEKRGMHAQWPRWIHATASSSLTGMIRNAFAYSTRMLLSVPSKLAVCRFETSLARPRKLRRIKPCFCEVA